MPVALLLSTNVARLQMSMGHICTITGNPNSSTKGLVASTLNWSQLRDAGNVVIGEEMQTQVLGVFTKWITKCSFVDAIGSRG